MTSHIASLDAQPANADPATEPAPVSHAPLDTGQRQRANTPDRPAARDPARPVVILMNGVPVLAPPLPDGGHCNPCFTDGTDIATPDGTVPIARISKGDAIGTTEGPCVVRRIGRVRVDIASQRRRDEMHLVRIRADALADGMPTRDLLLMQDHRIVLNGIPIPARMLVNGLSIRIDRTIDAYVCHHMTTQPMPARIRNHRRDRHATRQTRDPASRRSASPARNAPPQTGCATSPPARSERAPEEGRPNGRAADTTTADIAAIYREIARRAGTASAIGGLTPDAGLHLLTDQGDTMRPMTIRGGVARFMVPARVTSVRLRSRTARPADTGGPFRDDRRTLGVLVGSVALQSDVQNVAISTHLRDTDLEGWDGLEETPMRWTTGDAVLPLGTALNGGVRMLAVEIVATGRFDTGANASSP